MHRRTILSSSLAALALLAMPAGATASPGNTVRPDEPLLRGKDPLGLRPQAIGDGAPARVSAARPASAGARGFGGATAQQEPLAVNANAKRVSRFAIDWYGGCDDGDTWVGSTTMPAMRLKRGRFSRQRTETHDAGFGFSLTFDNSAAGRVSGSRVRGTFRTIVTAEGPDGEQVWRCDSGSVSYSVPRAYAGVTGDGSPLVLRVSGARRRVEGMLGWMLGECSTPNSFGFNGPASLQGGEVSGGRFHATGSERREQPGYVSDVTHELDGSLTARRSQGTWRAQANVSETASGQQVDQCNGETSYATVR